MVFLPNRYRKKTNLVMSLSFLITSLYFGSFVMLIAADTVNDTIKNEIIESIKERQIQQRTVIENRQNQVIEFKEGKDIINPTLSLEDLNIEEKVSEKSYIFKEVIFSGNKAVKTKTLTKLAKKYTNKPVSIHDIQTKLLEEIIILYQNKAYILALPYIPEQNIFDGYIEIIIQEGILENIEYDQTILTAGNVNLTFYNTIGKPVNLRYIEQGLEILNTSGAFRVTMAFKPGSGPGLSILVLNAEKIPNHFSLRLSVTNDYSKIRDNKEIRKETANKVMFSSGNGIIPNDIYSIWLNYNFKFPKGKWQKDNNSGGLGLNYIVPFSNWTFAFMNSTDLYKNIIKQTQNYESKGMSTNSSLEIKRSMLRTRALTTKIFSKATYYATRNFIDDAVLRTSSYDLSYFEFGNETQINSNKYTLFAKLSYVHGYPIAAVKNSVKDGISSQTRFSVYKVNLSNSYILNNRFTYVNNIDIQYTKDVLFTINDISITGSAGVRGFEGLETLFSTSGTGFTIQNELHTTLLRFTNKFISKLSLITAVDIGAPVDENNLHLLNDKSQPLYGIFLELRTSGKISFYINYAQALIYLKKDDRHFKAIKTGLTINF